MVFLDTNILLELVLPNRKHAAAVAELLGSLQDTTAISALSVHLVLHFGRKQHVDDSLLHIAIASHEIIDLTQEDYDWAKAHEVGKDFEDALQVAAALRSGCSQFVTLDKSLIEHYEGLIPFLSV